MKNNHILSSCLAHSRISTSMHALHISLHVSTLNSFQPRTVLDVSVLIPDLLIPSYHHVSACSDNASMYRTSVRALFHFQEPVAEMASSDEDEDLRRAIALPLQDSPRAGDGDETVTPTLQTVKASAYSSSIPTIKQPEARSSPITSTSNEQSTSTSQGIFGLDRKKMEEERLARATARKRQASISPPALWRNSGRPIKKVAISDNKSDSDQHSLSLGSTMPPVAGLTTLSQPSDKPQSSSGIKYPRGVVKKTWAFGHPRKDDIKIEEVLQKDDLTVAVLSAFDWDIDWILSKLNLAKTNMVFVMQAKGKDMVSKIACIALGQF